MPACTPKRNDTLLKRLNLPGSGIDTTEGGSVKRWLYTHTGGLLQFDGWSMPTQKLAWSRLDTFELCAACVASRSVLHACAWAHASCLLSAVGGAVCVDSLPVQAPLQGGAPCAQRLTSSAGSALRRAHFNAATHICSYQCWFSQFMNASHPSEAWSRRTMCLLYDTRLPSASRHSYCSIPNLATFPVANYPPRRGLWIGG
jgi:hypothetical protein